jgi:hypothetical protein
MPTWAAGGSLNRHGDALHRLGSWLFGQDCDRLEVAVHRLIDPPPARWKKRKRCPLPVPLAGPLADELDRSDAEPSLREFGARIEQKALKC